MKDAALSQKAFTLIELVLVIALLGVLLAIVTFNLFRPVSKATIAAVSSDIISLLSEAQTKAINTDTSGSAQTDPYGVHFDADKYILFKGGLFNTSDPNNFVVDVSPSVVITPNLPCPSPPSDCNNVVFDKVSGEIASFDPANNTICVSETASGKSVLLTINFLGVVNDVQQGC